jgi:hypothetical protein
MYIYIYMCARVCVQPDTSIKQRHSRGYAYTDRGRVQGRVQGRERESSRERVQGREFKREFKRERESSRVQERERVRERKRAVLKLVSSHQLVFVRFQFQFLKKYYHCIQHMLSLY